MKSESKRTSAPVVNLHPVMEAMARKLSGIHTVPNDERDRMVERACKEAAQMYDEKVAEVARLMEERNELRARLNAIPMMNFEATVACLRG